MEYLRDGAMTVLFLNDSRQRLQYGGQYRQVTMGRENERENCDLGGRGVVRMDELKGEKHLQSCLISRHN